MNTENHEIMVNGVPIRIVRKAIKNLHLGVYPPNGRVRVAAPLNVSDRAVRLAVVGKLGWIKRRRAKFSEQRRQTKREMVSGESHYFLGRRYRLTVVQHNGPAKVVTRNRAVIELHVRPKTDSKRREQVLRRWYRQQLREIVPPLLERWQARLCVDLADWGIKKMKTKWGACNIEARRVWLNLELAKKPLRCIEYIVVHELIHLRERNHSEHFISLMNKHLPGWRSRRDELNATPLADDIWHR